MWLLLWRFIAPGVQPRFKPAARSSFPFGFGWKAIPFARFPGQPLAICNRVEPAHACDRLIGMAEPWVVPTRWRLMICGFDERLIESICYGIASDCECINEYSMDGPFVRRPRVAAHQKLTRWDADRVEFDDHLTRRRARAAEVPAPYRSATFTSTGCPDLAPGL